MCRYTVVDFRLMVVAAFLALAHGMVGLLADASMFRGSLRSLSGMPISLACQTRSGPSLGLECLRHYVAAVV